MPADELILKSNLQELKDFMLQVTTITNEIRNANHHIEGVEKRVSTLTGWVEIAPPKTNENKGYDDEDDDIIYHLWFRWFS